MAGGTFPSGGIQSSGRMTPLTTTPTPVQPIPSMPPEPSPASPVVQTLDKDDDEDIAEDHCSPTRASPTEPEAKKQKQHQEEDNEDWLIETCGIHGGVPGATYQRIIGPGAWTVSLQVVVRAVVDHEVSRRAR